jgi:hypothetical protein
LAGTWSDNWPQGDLATFSIPAAHENSSNVQIRVFVYNAEPQFGPGEMSIDNFQTISY